MNLRLLRKTVTQAGPIRAPGARLSIVFAGLLTACAALGSKAIEGVNARRDTLASAVRPAAKAFVAEAGKAFEDSVKERLVRTTGAVGDRLEETLRHASDSLEHRIRRIEDSLAWFVGNPAKDAVGSLMTPNLDLLRASLRKSLGIWVNDLSHAVDSLLPEVTANLTERATNRATAALARNVDTTGALGRAVVGLGDRVVRQAIEAIRDESNKKGKTPWWVWATVAVVGVLVICAVGTFILALRRAAKRDQTSLRLMAQAIQERGDKTLARRVSSLAAEHGVEPQLHQFLKQHRLLVPDV
jgi:hypothetical protein